MQTEFEKGRQDVLSELETIINRRAKFIESILHETVNMAYSKEQRRSIFETYKEVLGTIEGLKNKERDSKRFAV